MNKQNYGSFFIKLMVFIILLLSTQYASAQNQSSQKKIDKELDRILDEYDTNLNIGIKVQNVSNGETLYEHNADRSFLPASNQKIFTASAALIHLGPDYKFITKVLADKSNINNGQLDGNVYFQFSGAPDLKTKDLNKLILDLKATGIHQINGNVVIDNTAYGPETIGPGWMWDDTRYCFSAPIAANIINENCLQFHVTPGSQSGKPLFIKPNYTNRFVNLENTTITKAKDKKGCFLKVVPGDNKNYIMKGCLPLQKKGIGLSVAMSEPKLYTKRVLKQLLEQNNIKVTGEFIIDNTPIETKEISRVESQPLKDLVTTMLKDSDNLISDSLFKTLGNSYFGKPGTWKSGAKAVQTILNKKFKMTFNNSVIVDGSGLSRYNLITPNHIIDLLNNVYNDTNLSANFITALPIGGIDGTLQHRMKDPEIRNRVHAKTGAMSGVTTLAGYIKTKNNKTLAFSIMINGAAGPVYKYRKIEDKLCQYLAQNY